jgi:hypothetical protein
MINLRRSLLRIWALLSSLWLAYCLFLVGIYGLPHANIIQVSIPLVGPPIAVFVAGLLLVIIWEILGESHWLRLADHMRRGIFRLYLTVSIPWIIWFAYLAFDAATDHRIWAQRQVPSLICMLLIVPLGGPALFVLISWVLDGFRVSASEKDETQLTLKRPRGKWWKMGALFRGAPPPVDYQTVMARAVSDWDYNTSLACQARKALYHHARASLSSELHEQDLSPTEITYHLQLFDKAILKTESKSRRRIRIARRGSTVLLGITMVCFPQLCAYDTTCMSVYWIVRLPRDLLDNFQKDKLVSPPSGD